MYPHHQHTIDRVTTHFQQDPNILAVIVGGSVAKGWAAEQSDVDIMLVVTDEEFARRTQQNEFLYFTRDFCDYEGGYVDGKYMDVGFLREVADHGSEPARAAFLSTWLTFSRQPEIDDLLKQITTYPEADREAKLKAFYSQMLVGNWFMGEAVKRQNKYLITHAARDTALFGGRLILAYNRMLYPYHKWFLQQLSLAPEKPHNMLPLMQSLLDNPGTETAQAFFDAVAGFRDWGVAMQEAFYNFTRDSEWNWRSQRPPIYDW